MKAKTLSVKNLVTLFGVTAMTIYNWKKGTASKDPLPAVLTVAAVNRWASRNAQWMSCDPRTLLGVGAEKPGPKPRVGEGLAMLVAYTDVPSAATRKPRGTAIVAPKRGGGLRTRKGAEAT